MERGENGDKSIAEDNWSMASEWPHCFKIFKSPLVAWSRLELKRERRQCAI